MIWLWLLFQTSQIQTDVNNSRVCFVCLWTGVDVSWHFNKCQCSEAELRIISHEQTQSKLLFLFLPPARRLINPQWIWSTSWEKRRWHNVSLLIQVTFFRCFDLTGCAHEFLSQFSFPSPHVLALLWFPSSHTPVSCWLISRCGFSASLWHLWPSPDCLLIFVLDSSVLVLCSAVFGLTCCFSSPSCFLSGLHDSVRPAVFSSVWVSLTRKLFYSH